MEIKFNSWNDVTTPLPRNDEDTIEFNVDEQYVYIRRGEESGFNEDEIIAVLAEASRHLGDHLHAERALAFAAAAIGLVRTFKVRQSTITSAEVFAIPGVGSLYADLNDNLLINSSRQEFAQWLGNMKRQSTPVLYLLNDPKTNAEALEHITKIAIGGSAGSYN